MINSDSFSCFIIGGETLLIECAEILLSKGNDIKGVITRAPKVANWATKNNIRLLDLDSDYQSTLSSEEFDYLFSITHLEIIADEILQLPRKMAINFHDGPLPRYAGINTPAWALMNQEEEYGITWHKIVPGVDQGDIIVQKMFAIDAEATSLSINTQCFATALETFPQVLDTLTASTPSLTAQNLEERSYFGKFKRPENAGFIDWTQPSKNLDAFIRALDFGEYANPIASPKSLFNNEVVIIKKAKASEESTSQPAGTIIDIDESHIKVSTGQGILHINQLQKLDGTLLSPGEASSKLLLKSGTCFNSPSPQLLEKLSQLNKGLCKNEEYWTSILTTLEPIDAPYARGSSKTSGATSFKSVQLSNNNSLNTAAFAILLAKLNQKSHFHLSYSDLEIKAQSLQLEHVVNDQIILSIDFDLNAQVNIALEKFYQHLNKSQARGSWLHDLIIRHKELISQPELSQHLSLPIGVIATDQISSVNCQEGSVLFLALTDQGESGLFYDPERFSNTSISKFANQLSLIIKHLESGTEQAINAIPLLSDEQQQEILVDWNNTHKDYDHSVCIHQLFEAQVQNNPDKTAIVFENQHLTFRELDARANQLAHHLISINVDIDTMVGVNVERSLDLMVATLGVMKAGAAYVPLDPAFPADRIEYMIKDAGMSVILTQESLAPKLRAPDATIIRIDSDWPEISNQQTSTPSPKVTSSNLAYVIYTSGSTGNPKGVMVEHRNAVNFFLGMDDAIPFDEQSTWLAVTSLSFDISVLELFWTLTRGVKVVIYKDTDKVASNEVPLSISNRPMDFGLFMWGNDDAPGSAKYRLLMEGAKYFDENGFDAVWTPERHFSAFGGPYPNPAVTSAAVAAITKNISVRSGSCVSPLHHPIRIAEDWAVVDNLSDGRVGLSFAAGWQPNDFVIMPQNHPNNKAIMLEQIETVKKLWRGESVAFENPMGDMVETSTLPRPVQKELPIWLTTAGNPETYKQAGAMGVNVLTHLLGQTVEELAEKVKIYRNARKEAGLDPQEGKVSLMLHTFVGNDTEEVRELVREPMKDYLRSSIKLVLDFAWTFPAFKKPGGSESTPDDINLKDLTPEEIETILDFAFDRYFETSGLFGTPEACLNMINRCKAADIDEIACLLDFGVETNVIMENLPLLKEVRDLSNQGGSQIEAPDTTKDYSLAAQIIDHKVTHFQCTPSHARMLSFDDTSRQALSTIKYMMVGGEALPTSLAVELKEILSGSLTNMYGPTETTIWSSTQKITDPNDITIGRPIANTQVYILDANKQPVPPGIAGDLYIGGDGVVRGYFNRPELTEERFIPNPFSNVETSRIYWTGDMARYRDDGCIEFLGRSDFQVKIRGYRIELGEIETKIGNYDGVQENVLLLREDNPGDQRLVSYIMTNDKNFDTSELKSFLRQQLPEYMVPSDIVILDSFPQTPNGKIDRKALPSPQETKQSTIEYVAPEDELEKNIAALWQKTLQLEKIGVNDNFFDLGGHSLLIVKLHSQLKNLINQPIALTDLYGYPTIKSLTQFLKSGGSTTSLKKSNDRAQRRRQMMGRRKR